MVRLDFAGSALIGNLMLENTLLDPKLHGPDALFPRGFKRSVGRDVLWGKFRKNKDGRFGVRQIKLEFSHRVCRVERRSDGSGQQEAILAFYFTNKGL